VRPKLTGDLVITTFNRVDVVRGEIDSALLTSAKQITVVDDAVKGKMFEMLKDVNQSLSKVKIFTLRKIVRLVQQKIVYFF
jgi:hypothetical protein